MSLILGGGISGLAAAFYALKSAPKPGAITLLESSSRLGGWVRSVQSPEGLIFEKGPRTIRPKGRLGANTLKLVEDLGLADQVIPITSSHPTAQNRLIYVNKKLHKLPSNFFSLFKTHSPFSKPLIFSILHDLTTKTVPKTDESIYDFVSRRFGSEVADYAVSSMICGICAGDAKKISVNFLMAKLFELEQLHGGVIKGAIKEMMSKRPDLSGYEESELYRRSRIEKWSVWSVEGGLQTIVNTLGEHLSNKVEVKMDTTCTNLEFLEKGVKVTLNNDQHIEANHVVSALPAPKLGMLLHKQHPTLGNLLSSIEHVNVAVINLAYENIPMKQNAFGFLVPPREKLPILGVVFDSCCFEQADWTILTVMMGGAWYDTYFKGQSKEYILDIACRYVHEILDMPRTPHAQHVEILKACIPQYTLGHAARVKDIQGYIDTHQLPLYLTGSSYDGVGVNDVIALSKKAVESIKWQHWGAQAG
ncbi:protoporphyrinogen oxidase-like [Diaphorina citri]|uniref:Protoporphyrinogen oxidase n=2 Tax=Diaphorina citri TaxID=121845 RepID=A0A1S3D9S5_DIACI|nr:protoporphyrinogen oxidase-like [Diaphorina citri]XP_008477445.1 protoporphyrinogen oxidase-like [Diaphorina citri]